MRRSIVGYLVERLNAAYDLDLEFPDGNQAIDGISNQEIDALLSFRSDSKLDELRAALTRFDNGTFGICIGCKNRMDWSLLLCDPGRRVCPNCEDDFRIPLPEASLSESREQHGSARISPGRIRPMIVSPGVPRTDSSALSAPQNLQASSRSSNSPH
jgi:RNA polymerase-binding transcription factor DksA